MSCTTTSGAHASIKSSVEVRATGLAKASFADLLSTRMRLARPKAVGLAVAYVSVAGLEFMNKLLASIRVSDIRLIADTTDAVTHPNALARALDEGWELRTVSNLAGTFHPKLYVGGRAFEANTGIADMSLVLIGSANLSANALERNVECVLADSSGSTFSSASAAWKECWGAGQSFQRQHLSEYAKYFAKRNKFRRPEDLRSLGVSDEGNEHPSMPNSAATTAWAGLQSFTGDYTLQVEFPRDAGLVLKRMLPPKGTTAHVDMTCDDGELRSFRYRYYQGNGMFRLNVPNSVPNVDWVRQNRNGIASVEEDDETGELSFRIIPLGRTMQEIMQRSRVLGTIGHTSTRQYGWY